MADELVRYAGVWGGRTESGEEMWWSAPDPKLRKSPWARFWFKVDLRHYMLHRFLVKALAGSSQKKVIDFGCGTGGTTINFSNLVGVPIEGFDIYETQLKIARQHNLASSSQCTFRKLRKDGTILLKAESVDVIIHTDVLGHVPDIPKTLRDFHRVLKKGGVMACLPESTYCENDKSIMLALSAGGWT